MDSGIILKNKEKISLSNNRIENSSTSKENLNKSIALKKPPFSPAKSSSSEIKPEFFSPSPAKKRPISSQEAGPTKIPDKNENPFCTEIKLFGNNNLNTTTNTENIEIKPTKKSTTPNDFTKRVVAKALNKSANSRKITRNLSQNLKSGLKSPQLQKTPGKKFQISSFFTPVTQKSLPKFFTPVLSQKKRKMPDTETTCKRISLFGQNSSFSPSQSSFSFKDQSTRIEDSVILGEITPIKSEENQCFQEESFATPVRTIKVYSSPEPASCSMTPGSSQSTSTENKAEITPESKNIEDFQSSGKKIQKSTEFKATRKGIVEQNTPESNFFTLSSSSELEMASEMSLSEEIPQSFGDISGMRGKNVLVYQSDKEMQTDNDLKEIIQLLHDSNVIDGLKIIGKITELLKVINK